ncbi:MAG: glycosyltransferase [Desulfovibrio sp.]|jgi:glycosyltransferase involved in cell wall biosynthesis|nr:glycosyltransferase [Desulfovibrio sp.]
MTVTTPKVSVLLPTWNAEMFLREAIDSIMAQTFKNFEIMIVDDGSTDGTRDIIASYADPRIVLLDGPRTGGLHAALNFGLQEARGEFVARMDADDLSMPTRFAEQVSFMDANSDISVLGAWSENFGTYVGRDCPPPTPAAVKVSLIFSYTMVHTSIMMRQRDLIKRGLFYSKDVVQEDYALWCDAVAQGIQLANIPKILARHRTSEWQRTGTHAPDALPKSEMNIRQKYLQSAFGITVDDKDKDLLYKMRWWDESTDRVSYLARLDSLFEKIEEEIIRQKLASPQAIRKVMQIRYMQWLDGYTFEKSFPSKYVGIRHKLFSYVKSSATISRSGKNTIVKWPGITLLKRTITRKWVTFYLFGFIPIWLKKNG